MCEHFRHFPDALERAAEIDATYGRNPDLEAMGLIGGAYQYDIVSNLPPESLSGPNARLTEVLIPARHVTYDPGLCGQGGLRPRARWINQS